MLIFGMFYFPLASNAGGEAEGIDLVKSRARYLENLLNRDEDHIQAFNMNTERASIPTRKMLTNMMIVATGFVYEKKSLWLNQKDNFNSQSSVDVERLIEIFRVLNLGVSLDGENRFNVYDAIELMTFDIQKFSKIPLSQMTPEEKKRESLNVCKDEKGEIKDMSTKKFDIGGRVCVDAKRMSTTDFTDFEIYTSLLHEIAHQFGFSEADSQMLVDFLNLTKDDIIIVTERLSQESRPNNNIACMARVISDFESQKPIVLTFTYQNYDFSMVNLEKQRYNYVLYNGDVILCDSFGAKFDLQERCLVKNSTKNMPSDYPINSFNSLDIVSPMIYRVFSDGNYAHNIQSFARDLLIRDYSSIAFDNENEEILTFVSAKKINNALQLQYQVNIKTKYMANSYLEFFKNPSPIGNKYSVSVTQGRKSLLKNSTVSCDPTKERVSIQFVAH